MSKEPRFGINDVLADLAKRRIDRRNQEGDRDSSESDSHHDDSDIDGNYRPSSNSSSDQELSDDQLRGNLINEENEIALNSDVSTDTDEPAVKRKRNRTKEKKEAKEARSSGLAYKNYRGVDVAAKSPKICDCSKCRLQCSAKISDDQRKIICATYYGLKVSAYPFLCKLLLYSMV